jgi:hypothetical protein
MRKTTLLCAAFAALTALGAAAQQTQPTASGSNTGSLQAGNLRTKPPKTSPGKSVNTRTSEATGSAQGGTHNGVPNPGSSARPRLNAANAQKTDKPASSGQAGQGTPGVHSKRKEGTNH